MWCGPIHQSVPLKSISIKPAKVSKDNPRLLVQYMSADKGLSDWMEVNERYSTKSDIVNMRAILVDGASKRKRVKYQLCQITGSGKTQNTSASHDGDWVLKEPNSPICGLKVSVIDI